MKRTITLIVLFCSIVFSQSLNSIQRGEVLPNPVHSLTGKKLNGFKSERVILKPVFNPVGTIDTLSWGAAPDVNFGLMGTDIMMQWFEAPADMFVKGLGFNILSMDSANSGFKVKLVSINYRAEELKAMAEKALGYYEAEGAGNYDAVPFPDNPDITGGWIDLTGSGKTDFIKEILWPEGNGGYTFFPKAVGYSWITIPEDQEIIVQKGTILGLAIEGIEPPESKNRIGVAAANSQGIVSFKYYTNGRLDPPNDVGWWTRDFTLDFSIAVELSSTDNWVFLDTEPLTTTLATEARYVEASLDVDPMQFNIELYLNYSFNNGDFTAIKMDYSGNNKFEAVIPGAEPGTHVEYYFSINENSGLTLLNEGIYSYEIFAPSSDNLLVFNGFTKPSGYPQSYYFGSDDFINYNVYDWDHDVWAFGDLTLELLENYTNVFEITTGGPKSINNKAIRTWLETDGKRNYFLAGDEWLGKQSNWTDSLEHSPGDFQFDILGIKKEFNDINLSADSGRSFPSFVKPADNSLLGGSLYNLFISIGDTMWYNPKFEINEYNWLDGVEFLNDAEVDMLGRGADGKWYSIGGHRRLPNGNKIVFLAFDPLSLDAPDAQYYWYGFSSASPQVQTLRWFGITLTDVKKENDVIPREFKLYQNYPNPFNPTTTIKYSIPNVIARSGATRQSVDVSFNIYDILGREIRTLVNKGQKPGNYTVEFNAAGLASGIYFYRITIHSDKLGVGEYSAVKKMILVK